MRGQQRDLRDFISRQEDVTTGPQVAELLDLYRQRREEIETRLADFRRLWREATEEDLFFEMAFCLCTPQSSAIQCDKAVRELREQALLLNGSQEEIMRVLDVHGVRFPENKARWIVEARKRFFSSEPSLRRRLRSRADDPFELRDWLVREVRGLGLKEASHYVRNIGLGEELAILDRHILNNLQRLGVIEVIPRSLTRARYLEIERRLRDFCRRVGIPMGHMDLLLWARQTGFVFK